MKLTLIDCLHGIAHEMCWGIRDAYYRIATISRLTYYGAAAAGRPVKEHAIKLCRKGFAHLDEQLKKKGMPFELRSIAAFLLVLPAVTVRLVLVAIVVALWMYHFPQVAVHTWNSVVSAGQHPNNKRTPKKSRPWERLDDFDDVRARIRELSYPEH